MRTYKKYTDEDIINNSKNVKSLAGLLGSLNLRNAGGNYSAMWKNIDRLKIDVSHWTGQLWNKGLQTKDLSCYTRANRIKPHLIRDRGHMCEECKLVTWRESKIPLEVHHIDGDRKNNEVTNLQLLCCNCHALTDTWRGRGNKIKAP